MIVEGIKTVLVGAFQQAFSDTFWSQFNTSTSQIPPEQIVLREYPVDKITFPMVRIGVDVSSLFWDNISPITNEKAPQEAQINGDCMIDMYALSAQARDMLLDGFIALMTWRKLQKPNAFDHYIVTAPLNNPALPLVKLQNGSIDIASIDDDEDLPWAENGGRIYAASMTMPFIATQGYSPSNYADIIKQVDSSVSLNVEK